VYHYDGGYLFKEIEGITVPYSWLLRHNKSLILTTWPYMATYELAMRRTLLVFITLQLNTTRGRLIMFCSILVCHPGPRKGRWYFLLFPGFHLCVTARYNLGLGCLKSYSHLISKERRPWKHPFYPLRRLTRGHAVTKQFLCVTYVNIVWLVHMSGLGMTM
jgi:hypothetical protein